VFAGQRRCRHVDLPVGDVHLPQADGHTGHHDNYRPPEDN
jgi:hypothetical protein